MTPPFPPHTGGSYGSQDVRSTMPSAVYEGGYARSYPGERTSMPALAPGGDRWARVPEQGQGPPPHPLDDEVSAPRQRDDNRWVYSSSTSQLSQAWKVGLPIAHSPEIKQVIFALKHIN